MAVTRVRLEKRMERIGRINREEEKEEETLQIKGR